MIEGDQKGVNMTHLNVSHWILENYGLSLQKISEPFKSDKEEIRRLCVVLIQSHTMYITSWSIN